MQHETRSDAAPDGTWDPGPSYAVLADRIAAAVVHHEPGWRLPRASALARRYQVSVTAIEAAITDLTERHILRRLPDGQVHRASPAEYLISVPDLPGFGVLIDPMGTEMALAQTREALRRPAEGLAHALGLEPAELARVTQCLWTANGERAAVTTAYLVTRYDVPSGLLAATLSPTLAGEIDPGAPAQPVAMSIQAELPSPSIGRKLRLRPGETVFILTMQFADHRSGMTLALTEAVLRPGFFRLIVQSGQPPQDASRLPGSDPESLP